MSDTESLTVRKLGNSVGFLLPASWVRDLNFEIGQQLDATKEPGRLTVEVPKKPRYTRAELLSLCDPKAPVPADMAIWDSVTPVGAEVV